MSEIPQYVLVDINVLPEVFEKVLHAKLLLAKGIAKSSADACRLAEVSRGAFYKYKDAVRPFYEMLGGKIITFHIMLEDRPGVLSGILRAFAESGANILTVNQTIPINGQAALTISAETAGMSTPIEEFIRTAEALDGVSRIELLAGE